MYHMTAFINLCRTEDSSLKARFAALCGEMHTLATKRARKPRSMESKAKHYAIVKEKRKTATPTECPACPGQLILPHCMPAHKKTVKHLQNAQTQPSASSSCTQEDEQPYKTQEHKEPEAHPFGSATNLPFEIMA